MYTAGQKAIMPAMILVFCDSMWRTLHNMPKYSTLIYLWNLTCIISTYVVWSTRHALYISDLSQCVNPGLINLPGWCWAEIQQFALVGSSSSLHSEACNALGASDGVIHSRISHEVVCFWATTNMLMNTMHVVWLEQKVSMVVFDVWCIVYDVRCIVWCMMYDSNMYEVWCVICDVWCMCVWCMKYDVWCMMHVWCVMCDWWCVMYDACMYDVRCVMCDVWCMMCVRMMYDVWCIMHVGCVMCDACVHDVWCTTYDV